MARVLLTTLADEEALGIRILGSALAQAGHTPCLLYLCNFIDCMSPWKGEKILDNEYMVVDDSGGVMRWNNPTKVIDPVSMKLYQEEIRAFQPDIIAFSGRSFFDAHARSFLSMLKNCAPHALIVSGGHGPTFSPESYLKSGDCVILGEGEKALVELAHAVDTGSSWRDIPNLCWKDERGELHKSAMEAPITNLDTIPFPLYGRDTVHISKGVKYLNNTNTSAYYTLAGRGCLMSCSYCGGGNWPKLYTKQGLSMPKRRRRSLDQVLEELLTVKKSKGYTFVHFCDEHFAYPTDQLINFFKKYKRLINVPFFCYFHAAQIVKHPEILLYAREAGIVQASLGIQTGSEKFAQEVFTRKNQNEVILECAKLLYQAEIGADYQFIMGSPFDTEQKILEDFTFCSQLPFLGAKTRLTCFYFTAHKGAPIYNKIKDMRLRQDINTFLYNSLLLCLCRYIPLNRVMEYYQTKKYDINTLRNMLNLAFMNSLQLAAPVNTAHGINNV